MTSHKYIGPNFYYIDRLVKFARASTSSSTSRGDVIAHAYKALLCNLTILNVFPTTLNVEILLAE